MLCIFVILADYERRLSYALLIIISRPLAAIEKVQEGKKSSEGGGAFFCRRLWLPSLSQIFVWKVLDNPLFVYLLFSFLSIGFFY